MLHIVHGQKNAEYFCCMCMQAKKGADAPAHAFLRFKGKSEISGPPSSEATDFCIWLAC